MLIALLNTALPASPRDEERFSNNKNKITVNLSRASFASPGERRSFLCDTQSLSILLQCQSIRTLCLALVP